MGLAGCCRDTDEGSADCAAMGDLLASAGPVGATMKPHVEHTKQSRARHRVVMAADEVDLPMMDRASRKADLLL